MASRTILTLAVMLLTIGLSNGLFCTFESDFCGLIRPGQNLKWSRRSGVTPTPLTGPISGYKESDFYAFIESTGSQVGDKARLTTSTLTQNIYCVKFAYHMFGSTIGRLNLYVETSIGKRLVRWSVAGNHGPKWLTYSGKMFVGEESRIGWEVIRGDGDTGDLAIDNVSVKPCTQSCGLVKVSSPKALPDGEAKVVGGGDATYGRWPWQVLIKYSINATHVKLCGGTLISNRIVMTAAHCVKDPDESKYKVVVGEHRRHQVDAFEKTVSVTKIKRHKKYTGESNREHDIALLRISVCYNKYVQPACLPYVFGEQPPESPFYITGWGRTADVGKASNILQKAVVPLVPLDKCNAVKWYHGILTQNQMCAGDSIRTACKGDSGGPLQCLESGRYTVYGITSWHYVSCTSHPTVYVTVSRYIHWIRLNQSKM